MREPPSPLGRRLVWQVASRQRHLAAGMQVDATYDPVRLGFIILGRSLSFQNWMKIRRSIVLFYPGSQPASLSDGFTQERSAQTVYPYFEGVLSGPA
jgi:hypothetical protein